MINARLTTAQYLGSKQSQMIEVDAMADRETEFGVDQEKDEGWGLYRFGFINAALVASVTFGNSGKDDDRKEAVSAETVAAYLEALNKTMNGVL